MLMPSSRTSQKGKSCLLGNHFEVFIIYVLSFLFPAISNGGEFYDWKVLPQIDNFVFSEDTVGLFAADGRIFLLERQTGNLQQIDTRQLRRRFPKRLPRKPLQRMYTRVTRKAYDLLRSSSGEIFVGQKAYCDEGCHQLHGLWHERQRVPDHVKPCNCISTIEIVEDQLWMGTYYNGELGHLPAEGILVQRLDTSELLARIRARNGLTSDLVRVIRKDPYGPDIWVATNLGLNRINREFTVVYSAYFYEDFERRTGRSRVMLHTRQRKSNPFAVASRLLAVQDQKKFFRDVENIPRQLRKRFCLATIVGRTSSYRVVCGPHSESFLPSEFNVLLPYVFEALRTPDHNVRSVAENLVCLFRHECVLKYVQSITDPLKKWHQEPCIKKLKSGAPRLFEYIDRANCHF